MINDETKRKLRELKLYELIAAIEINEKTSSWLEKSFDDKFQIITDYLYQEKYNKSIKMLIRRAGFRIAKAEVHNLFFDRRGLDRNKIMELATCQYLSRSTSIIIQGFTGSGKTYLACALGREACKQRVKVRYVRMPDLLIEYDEEKTIHGNAKRLIKRYGGYGLLIIDEWLMNEASDEELHLIMEIIEKRYDCHSTIFCTQYKKENWHERLGGGVLADAIMDRIIHNAVSVETGELNMREFCSKQGL